MELELKLSWSGRSLAIGAGGPYYLTAVSGLEAGEYALYTSANALLDGATVIGQRVLPRPIEITGEIQPGSGMEDARNHLISFLHPKQAGELTARRGLRERRIGYRLEALNVSQSTLFCPVQFRASLLCPAPYFLDLSNYGKNAAQVSKQFAFPLIIPRPGGKIMGYREMPRRVSVRNNGDLETGLEVRFIAARGVVINPALSRVDTGEFLRVEAELARGDELIVRTGPGEKQVLLNGVGAFQQLDRRSIFFQLSVGTNALEYDADENYSNLDVWLYFTPKYLGV